MLTDNNKFTVGSFLLWELRYWVFSLTSWPGRAEVLHAVLQTGPRLGLAVWAACAAAAAGKGSAPMSSRAVWSRICSSSGWSFCDHGLLMLETCWLLNPETISTCKKNIYIPPNMSRSVFDRFSLHIFLGTSSSWGWHSTQARFPSLAAPLLVSSWGGHGSAAPAGLRWKAGRKWLLRQAGGVEAALPRVSTIIRTIWHQAQQRAAVMDRAAAGDVRSRAGSAAAPNAALGSREDTQSSIKRP